MVVVRSRAMEMVVGRGWSIVVELPKLQRSFSQQVVQAWSFVLSPIIMHPGSQCLVQFLWSSHKLGPVVPFSVEV